MLDLRARKPADRPLIVGHRGALAVAPENTMAAFQAGLAGGADIIELDVQLTADDQVVVYHDFDLGARTTLQGPVRAYPAEVITDLDVGSAFGPAFAGARIPLLVEALAWARGRVPLFIELKHEPALDDGLEDRVIDLIEDFGMVDEVALISLDQFALRRAKARHPGIAASFLYIGRFLDPLRLVAGLTVEILSPATNFLTSEEVRRIQAAGYLCSPGGLWWDYPLLRDWGVDTVSSNDPASVRFD